MKNTTPTRNNPRHIAMLIALAALLIFLVPIQADEIQSNNLWVPNATIQNVVDGQIVYITNLGSEVNIPMTQVQGIKVPAYPDLWAAQEASAAGKDAIALPLLLKLQGQARQPWLKNHAAWLAVHALDRMGRTTQAVEGYLAVAREKPDSFYLQRPPLSSLAGATDAQKKDLAERLELSAPEFDGVTRSAIAEMIKRLAVTQTTPAAGATDGSSTTPATSTPATSTPATSTPAPSTGGIVDANAKVTNNTGVAFSSYLVAPDRDPVSPLLYEGQWEQAVAKAKELLQGNETRMSMRLYQLGLAQLQLAEKSGNEDEYKDAGLSLSRSLIYFPTSSVSGPCLVELGYIHTKIGRTDLALKLWDKARLQVDETQDPAVFARLEKLIAGASHTQ